MQHKARLFSDMETSKIYEKIEELRKKINLNSKLP
jgi:hypothetical protein